MKANICKNYNPQNPKKENHNKVAYGWEMTDIPWKKDDIVKFTTQYGISGNQFNGSHRTKEDWVATHFIMLDFEEGTYNLFKPTEYQLMARTDVIIQPIKEFPNIYRLLSNLIPKKKQKDYFLNWLAAILQTRKKMMMAFVFIGSQGAGKGVFLGHILKPLFGELQTIQVEDEQLKSSFNGWLKNAFFIAFNEVAHDNRGRNSLNSKIKSIVTDPSIIVNEKNIRTYQIDNNVNCVFFSNERVPLLVERSDRRFTIIETGGNLAKQEWFQVPKSFKDFERELPAFAQYLWNKTMNMDDANTPLETDMKDMLISAGQNRWDEFAFHLKNADEEWFEDHTHDIEDLYPKDSFSGKRKYDSPQYTEINWKGLRSLGMLSKECVFRLYSELHQEKNLSLNSFSKHLAPYGIVGFRSGTGENRIQMYKWTPVNQG